MNLEMANLFQVDNVVAQIPDTLSQLCTRSVSLYSKELILNDKLSWGYQEIKYEPDNVVHYSSLQRNAGPPLSKYLQAV